MTYRRIQDIYLTRNVSVRQGPIQRYFGIADVLVETAGGGSGTGQGEGGSSVGHHGLLEGIDNAEEVRNLILAKWRVSADSGLGDSPQRNLPSVGARSHYSGSGFTPSEVSLLAEIRDLAVRLSASK